jgi:hypothetical protein
MRNQPYLSLPTRQRGRLTLGKGLVKERKKSRSPYPRTPAGDRQVYLSATYIREKPSAVRTNTMMGSIIANHTVAPEAAQIPN